MTALAPSLQAYFTQRLIGERACLTCGRAADVFSWLALSRAVVRTQCGPSRPGGTGLGRALNTGS